MSLPRQNNF